MKIRTRAAIGSATAAASVLLLLVPACGSDTSPSPGEAGVSTERATPSAAAQSVPRGPRVGCSARSEANFPGAYTDPGNLVVGPLVMVGGGKATPAHVVEQFGGQKFPLLVRAGHRVTVRVPQGTRTGPGLAYGPFGNRPQQTITFVSCPPGRSSGSSADGAVTFWSGFVKTRTPSCVALKVYVDDAPSPRGVELSLGARCPQ